MSVSDAYMTFNSEKIRAKVQEAHSIIRDTPSGAAEKISWNMPPFYTDGTIIHFAAYKKHMGFYPLSRGTEYFTFPLKAAG